jgi:hypothetical protein
MVKSSSLVSQWNIVDNKRDTTNPATHRLFANLSNAEATGIDALNFLSNGFQIANNDAGYNSNNDTYIYMAFAADPDTEAPTVAKSFSTVAYTGDGTSNKQIDLGFKPGLYWLKTRDTSGCTYHNLFDIIRGGNKTIYSNVTSAEVTNQGCGYIQSFDDNGVTYTGDASGINNNGEDFVAWAWKADDNEPTINTEGSIDSLVSANANAGFSIVKYEGNSTAGTTIGHGLSAVPEMIIVKRLESPNDNWAVYNETIGNTKRLALDESGAAASNRLEWNSTTPSATTFTLGNHSAVNTGSSYIAYCFHSVSGYSDIGSYTGNGNATGPTVTLGFRPDWIMIKEADNTNPWFIFDSVRGGTNPISKALIANSSSAEDNDTTNYKIDFNDNDFQLKSSYHGLNRSGSTYIYMAFKIN